MFCSSYIEKPAFPPPARKVHFVIEKIFGETKTTFSGFPPFPNTVYFYKHTSHTFIINKYAQSFKTLQFQKLPKWSKPVFLSVCSNLRYPTSHVLIQKFLLNFN